MNNKHAKERSVLADRQAARQAIELVMPMIVAGIASRHIGDSGFLYIVVMDPGLRPEHADFEHSILYEHAVGDRDAWDADYAAFAREKARICWRTQRNGHEVRYIVPHLLCSSDTGVWGGVWVEDIAVGVSGADPWFDEAIAASIAYFLRALAKKRALALPERVNLIDDHD